MGANGFLVDKIVKWDLPPVVSELMIQSNVVEAAIGSELYVVYGKQLQVAALETQLVLTVSRKVSI